MTRSHLLKLFCASILTMVATLASAQTPDGETPATEDICNDVKGGTPGLYGLCVAFCEAQDNDMSTPLDLENHPKPASSRILANYRKRMRGGDPDMPCLKAAPSCPCWEQNDVDSVGTGIAGGELVCGVSANSNLVYEFGSGAIYAQTLDNPSGGGTKTCFWYNGDNITGLSATSPITPLTDEEYANCSLQIANRCAELGLP